MAVGPQHTRGHHQAQSGWVLGGEMLSGRLLVFSSGAGPTCMEDLEDRSRQPAPARSHRDPGAGNISGLRARSLLIPSSEKKKFCFFADTLQALYFFKKTKIKH